MVDMGISKLRFISKNKSSIMVRVPGCEQKNFKISDWRLAIEHRDKLCALVGRSPLEKLNRGRRFHYDVHSDKTSDLPVGITFCMSNKTLADGSNVSYKRVAAHSLCSTGPRTKSYSVNKFGEKKAIELAIKWREESGKKEDINKG